MTATVHPLFSNGRVTARAAQPVTGDLNLSIGKNPVTGAVDTEACILADNGAALLPSLYDARCVVIAAHGLRLRGVEIVAGRQVAQEWWCQMPAEAKKLLAKSPETH